MSETSFKHKLKNCLNNISISLQLIDKDTIDKENSDMIEIIDKNIQKMEELFKIHEDS